MAIPVATSRMFICRCGQVIPSPRTTAGAEKTTQPWNANLPEFAASFDNSTWAPADVQSITNQLGDNEHGVFRAHLKVTEQELAANVVELCFGAINGNGKIYVNGQKAGETRDGGMASSVDVKHLLHPGDTRGRAG